MFKIDKKSVSVRITVIYAVISTFYIYFSDRILFLVYDKNTEFEMVSIIETIKGVVFVLSTSLMLYYLINKGIKAKDFYIEKLEASERNSNRIQNELRKRNEYIEYVLKHLPIGIAVNKIDTGETVLINDVFTNVFDKSQEKINSINAIYDAFQSQDLRERISQQIQSSEGSPTEIYKEGLKIVTKEGVEKYINVKSMVINDHNLLISTVNDLTSMVLNERRLRESKELLEKIINNLNEVVLLVEPENRTIKMANKAVHSVFGYEPDELLGQPTAILHIDKEKFEKFGEMSEPVLAVNSMFNTEYQMLRKDGVAIHTEITVTSIRDDRGWQYGVISVIRNITEKKKTERKLMEYRNSLKQLTYEQTLTEERFRKQIAANIHDHLSQLLIISKMKLTQLLKCLDTDTKRSELNNVVGYLSEAIENARKITYDLSPPMLYEMGLIETMFWYAEKIQKEHGIAVSFITNTNDLVLTDEQLILLFRIIQELVTNVYKHARAGKIVIGMNKIAHNLKLVVEDDGIGFDTGKLDHNSPYESGYGLFSVKERVENLNGKFNLSTVLHSGTSVNITIPLFKPNSE